MADGRETVDRFVSDPADTRAEASRLLATDEQELFAALVPVVDQEELHSFNDVVARGRQIFRRAFLDTRDVVCPVYQKHRLDSDESDLALLIAGSLVGQTVLGGIPVVPLAALMVKIGLGKLCAAETVDA